MLADEDVYYHNRKTNSYCQNTINESDQIICTKNKFNKFLFLYIDSLPFDLFSY